MLRNFWLIIFISVYSLKANACVIPEYSMIADASILVAIICCGFAVLFRRLAKKRKIWKPIFTTAVLSMGLIPFYFYTPESFYVNCGSGQVSFLYLLMCMMVLIPLYELVFLFKAKLKTSSL